MVTDVNLKSLDLKAGDMTVQGGFKSLDMNGQNAGSMVAVVNGVNLTSTGGGTQFLSNDGGYKTVSGVSTNLDSFYGSDSSNRTSTNQIINYTNSRNDITGFMPISSNVGPGLNFPFTGAVAYTTAAPFQILLETSLATAQAVSKGDIISVYDTATASNWLDGRYFTVLEVLTNAPQIGLVLEGDATGKATGTGLFYIMNSFKSHNAINFKLTHLLINPVDIVGDPLGFDTETFDLVLPVATNEENANLAKTSGGFQTPRSNLINVTSDSSTDKRYVGVTGFVSASGSSIYEVTRWYRGMPGGTDPVSGNINFALFTPVIEYIGANPNVCNITFGMLFDCTGLVADADVSLRLYRSENGGTFQPLPFPIVTERAVPNSKENLKGDLILTVKNGDRFLLAQAMDDTATIITQYPYIKFYGVS